MIRHMGNLASLNAATTVGPGSSSKLAMSTARHTMIVTVTGAPGMCAVVLQGSHDGANWTDIGNVQSATGGIVNTSAEGALVTYVRADLRTLTGQASVTASIASADGT